MRYDFISNTNLGNNENLYKHLETYLESATSFCFSVAFINFAGVQILLDILKKAEEKNIKGRILTTNYLNFTDLKSVDYLKKFKNIEVKFFDSERLGGFHTKGYIFEYKDSYRAIVGSSNLTKSGLKSNVEWNTSILTTKDSKFIKDIQGEFNYLWGKAVDEVKAYEVSFVKRKIYQTPKVNDSPVEDLAVAETLPSLGGYGNKKPFLDEYFKEIEPNYMQSLALKNLENLRKYGENKALCIAATGTGKTYLAAFDVRNFRAKRLLFIVHNEEILDSAKKSFEKIIPNKLMGKFTGNEKNLNRDYVFATIQSLNNHYSKFRKDEFDYIIIDEAHHATASSYKKILDYFKPQFLLGLTATPERCDDGNIYEVFNMNVPVEIRLQEALDRNLVVPFHYYGVKDIEEVDLENIDLTNISEVTKALNVEKRVDFIIEKMKFYGHSGNNRKVVGFCVSIEHAKYMAEEFNKRGINSISLTGSDGRDVREEVVKNFKTREDLEVIFTVNIFNEGVDIPCINTILMLRPTASPIIFTQQLGRGLRHYENKEFLTVIDFIGNHSRAFLIALALIGKKGYDKESVKIAVKRDFDNLSKSVHIKMEEICKEEILNQLDKENFNSFKYLKEEYNEFKDSLKGRIPQPIDFIEYEESPKFYKYSSLQKSYLDFLYRLKEDAFKTTEEEIKVVREIEKMLPIKRIYEYAIIREILSREEGVSEKELIKVVGKYVDIIDVEYVKKTINHAIRYLTGKFYDSQELKKGSILIEQTMKENNKIGIKKSAILKSFIKNTSGKDYVISVLDYGLLKYGKVFGRKDHGFPFLKSYETYNMRDVALLCNYEKIHSSFRGQGLFCIDRDFFIFIELHKGEDIKESINYKDKIIDRMKLQWQSPNATRIDSNRGQEIVKNKEKNINLHIFVRKYKAIDREVQPYIYIGQGNVIEHHGSKPITTTIELEQPLPKEIYVELTEIVENKMINKEKKFAEEILSC